MRYLVLVFLIAVTTSSSAQRMECIGDSRVYYIKKLRSSEWGVFKKDSIALFVRQEAVQSLYDLFIQSPVTYDSIFSYKQAAVANSYQRWLRAMGRSAKKITFSEAIAVYEVKIDLSPEVIIYHLTYRGLDNDCYMRLVYKKTPDGRLRLEQVIPDDCQI